MARMFINVTIPHTKVPIPPLNIHLCGNVVTPTSTPYPGCGFTTSLSEKYPPFLQFSPKHTLW